jgi:predicted HicB family RNase H-like nuclease
LSSELKEHNVSTTSTYPLRLPKSLKDAVELASRKDGTSMNQFVAMAVAEKISALETATFLVCANNVLITKNLMRL